MLAPQSKKYKSLRIRTYSTIILIGGFIGFVCAGHVPLMFVVVGLQVGLVLASTRCFHSCIWHTSPVCHQTVRCHALAQISQPPHSSD